MRNTTVENGVLRTVQSLRKEKLARKDQIVDPVWHEFLVAMLWIGGVAIIGWIFWSGYQAGRASRPAVTASAAPVQSSVKTITTADIRSAIGEATAVLKAADELRGQVKSMAQSELPPQQPQAAPNPASASKPEPKKPSSVWDLKENR